MANWGEEGEEGMVLFDAIALMPSHGNRPQDARIGRWFFRLRGGVTISAFLMG